GGLVRLILRQRITSQSRTRHPIEITQYSCGCASRASLFKDNQRSLSVSSEANRLRSGSGSSCLGEAATRLASSSAWLQRRAGGGGGGVSSRSIILMRASNRGFVLFG